MDKPKMTRCRSSFFNGLSYGQLDKSRCIDVFLLKLNKTLSRFVFNASSYGQLDKSRCIDVFLLKLNKTLSRFVFNASSIIVLLYILALFSDIFKAIFGYNYHFADFGELVFTANSINLAVHFLADKIKFFTRSRIIFKFKLH